MLFFKSFRDVATLGLPATTAAVDEKTGADFVRTGESNSIPISAALETNRDFAEGESGRRGGKSGVLDFGGESCPRRLALDCWIC
jgi:hypothetical protein